MKQVLFCFFVFFQDGLKPLLVVSNQIFTPMFQCEWIQTPGSVLTVYMMRRQTQCTRPKSATVTRAKLQAMCHN